MRAAVYGIGKQLGTDATVIQQSIAFRGSAVACDALSLSAGADEKLHHAAFSVGHGGSKAAIRVDTVQACRSFGTAQCRHSLVNRFCLILLVLDVEPDGSAMRR